VHAAAWFKAACVICGLVILVEGFLRSSKLLWARFIVDIDTYSRKDLLSWMTFVLVTVSFWFFSLWYLFLDFFMKPKWLHSFKIQKNRNSPLSTRMFARALFWVLFNQFVVTGLFLVFVGEPLLEWSGCKTGISDFPTTLILLRDFVIIFAVEEILFYYAHVALHSNILYEPIHKMHHEWTAPISITAVYSHPLEHILSNLIPITAGPVLARSHIVTTWLWFLIATFSTIHSHSGYHLPFFASPEAHDYHHRRFSCNYGVFGILDALHGTDKIFKSSDRYPLHVTFFEIDSPLIRLIQQ